jgi:hypothetical protein
MTLPEFGLVGVLLALGWAFREVHLKDVKDVEKKRAMDEAKKIDIGREPRSPDAVFRDPPSFSDVCTRPAPHVCRLDGPCNGLPRRGGELQAMWEQQEAFMRLLQEKRGFPLFPTDITSKPGQKFLKDIRNHIMEELFEAGQHLKNAKSHRATELPEVDREAYKEELVDALHLFFELAIASGISREELVDAYLSKGRTNENRIRTGY